MLDSAVFPPAGFDAATDDFALCDELYDNKYFYH